MKNIVIIFLICSAALAVHSLCLKEKIVGGEVVAESQMTMNSPYIASLLIDGKFSCAATLVTRLHLLTVAHCVYTLILLQEITKSVAILMGSPKRNRGNYHLVQKISHHYEFIRTEGRLLYEHNIAVIHLRIPVIMNRRILPIGLPKMGDKIAPLAPVIISGFGGHFLSKEPSVNLSRIILTLAPIDRCQQKYPIDKLTDSHLCTMSITGFGCSIGDDGSPMVDLEEKTILGISSFGTYGCHTGIPDVYTKVAAYADFIYQEIYSYEYRRKLQIHPSVEFPERPPYIFATER